MLLKVLRVLARKTQAEAALEVGVSQVAVSRWESGKLKPSASSRAKLAAAYGVSVAEINEAVDGSTN
ncbi:MAG: helix-turn-helix transcriptional regulator [Candidatus Faecousia sp.]|nr:helix-turn-helix transcriptional regulator [Candidatus Faecousia sp.]